MWSYSKLSTYEKCPYQLVLKKEHKQATSVAMQRGINLHQNIELFLQNKGSLPQEAKEFEDGLLSLREQDVKTEYTLYVNHEWQPCEKDNAWGIAILDALIIAPTTVLIFDWKTGKPNPVGHLDQAQIYALVTKAHYPEHEIKTSFWYIDKGTKATTIFHSDKFDHYRKVLTARLNKMENDTELNPKPNKYVCKWCNYKEHCEYKDDG